MSPLYSDTHPKVEAGQSHTQNAHACTTKDLCPYIGAHRFAFRFPDATEAELRRRLADLLLGEKLACGRNEKHSLSKLEWYRMGVEVSDRQWRDIPGILKTRTATSM